ncbi:hypothetical protein [Bosea sp. (in: a-proteobacteria)]|uniref:hypothetical protein n=1 Tax=Bosea sp. (in: a-proteobacteria) TaxID=1871050 RepID=UPI001ACCF266|nr:hypothetical protein [Bosea sp. (in: a-proteobacteria)]MBN9438337.1 hypothetical protein [Bosea sp. (in: a-proteobacteria)]
MNLRQITDAIIGEDRETMRQAFGLLVAYPEAGRVEALSPGMLVVVLNRLCGGLVDDSAAMPPATCLALGLEAGANYAQGAAQAKRDWTRISGAIVQR